MATEAEEKDREKILWSEFAETGKLPESVRCLVDERGVDYVKNLLAQRFNHLTKLISAERLMVREGVVEPYLSQQAEAARWVRILIFAKTRNYEHKQKMASSLVVFMNASLNPLLNKVNGLVKAREMLRQKSSSGTGAVEFSARCLDRLIELKESNEGFGKVEEFQKLGISVAWEFVRNGDGTRFKKVMALLPNKTTGNSYLDEQMVKLRGKTCSLVLKPICEWTFKARDLYHELPASMERVKEAIRELGRHVDLITRVREETKTRDMMLMWLSLFLVKLKSTTNGIGPEIGNCLVQILRADGLEELSEACWERKEINPPPEKGNGVLPAPVEKLVNGLYSIVKDWRLSEHSDAVPTVEWLIGRLEAVYSRLPDGKWGDFRIGRLLMLLGRMDEAKNKVLPTVRRNSTQFWAWDAMGHLFPEYRRACIAKAMLCPAEEQMKTRVRQAAVDLGLPIDSVTALRQESIGAEDLLLVDLVPERGVLEARYKNKEGKERIRFYCEDGVTVRPVSPGAVNLPRGVEVGAPVTVFRDEGDPSRIFAARRREGALWDLLPQVDVVFYGQSRKGNAQLAAESFETTCPMEAFPQLREVKFGESIVIRYLKRKRDFVNEKNATVYDVKSVAITGQESNRVFAFEGPLRMPNGLSGPLFVKGVFIPRDFVDRLLDRGVEEGTVMSGTAVKLPPRMTTDRFGNRRLQFRSQAITLDILGGEELERYRMENS